MKKYLFLIFTFLSLTLLAQNSGGPGPYGYVWYNSDHATRPANYSWIDIEANENYVDGLGDDNIVGPFSVTPAFNYFWYTVDKIWIGSNGYVGFKPVQVSSAFPIIPTNSYSKNNFIAGFMCDLTFAPDTQTIAPGGTVPNPARCYYYDSPDTTVISYVNVPFWSDPNTNPIQGQEWVGYNTFQIVLNKSDSTIYINYKDRDVAIPTNSNDIKVGLQSKVGSFGIQHTSGIYFDMFSANGMPNALRYEPPSHPGLIKDVAVNWNDNMDNKGIFLSADGANYTLKTNIKNEGNTPFGGGIDVIVNLSPQFSPPIVTNSATLNTLNAGADTTFVLTNTFQPTSSILGPHTFLTMLSGAVGDMDPTNNILEQEIVVIDTTQTLINLSYAHTPGGGSINWSGGNGGIAVYFEPPFYPALIKSTNFYIENNTGAASFDAKIYDDDGLNGAAGTLLDSVTVMFPISPGNNVVACASPDTIWDGGVYVLWYMGAAGIGLGKDVTPPISGQTYEVLSNFWATYRDVENEDFFISIDIEKLPFSDDIGVATIVTPANGSTLGTSQNIEATIENFGINAASNFDVNYQFNSGITITETVTATVAPGSTINHVFTTTIGPMSVGAPSAQLCVWTSYSVDPNPINNQFCNMLNAPTTGVNEQEVSKIVIYPNPTTGKLYLENLPKEKIYVNILDINGKTVYKTTELIGEAIDISTLSEGIYQIKLEGKDWVWNKKLIKQ